MKIKLLHIIFFLLITFLSSQIIAQRGSNVLDKKRENNRVEYDSIINIIDSIKETLPSLEISFDAANKAVFWGRTFGLNQYSAEPSLLFNTGKGLYFYNTNYYWSEDADPNFIAKSDFGIGYEKDLTDNLSASLSYERWLYYNGENVVKHAIQNSIEAQTFYDLDFLNLELSAYYMFGNINIIETDFNISQEFYLCSISKRLQSRLFLFPQISSIFANKNFLPIYSDIPANFKNNTAFKIIDLELNIPLRLEIRDFEIEPNFHYNIPINQPNENLKSFTYFSIRLAYNFYFDKHKAIKTLTKTISN